MHVLAVLILVLDVAQAAPSAARQVAEQILVESRALSADLRPVNVGTAQCNAKTGRPHDGSIDTATVPCVNVYAVSERAASAFREHFGESRAGIPIAITLSSSRAARAYGAGERNETLDSLLDHSAEPTYSRAELVRNLIRDTVLDLAPGSSVGIAAQDYSVVLAARDKAAVKKLRKAFPAGRRIQNIGIEVRLIGYGNEATGPETECESTLTRVKRRLLGYFGR